MDLVALIPLLLIFVGIYLLLRRKRMGERRLHDRLQRETELALAVVENPSTDISVLKEYLLMPIPHDASYHYHLEILRALARNPSLPTDLQSAAINRLSNEETAAQIDKSMRRQKGGGSRGFIGMSQEFGDG